MTKYNSILDINEILNDYSHEIQEAITEEAIEVAKDGVKRLKDTSPKSKRNTKHKGKYAKGWRVKIEKGQGFVNCVIHNATDWQLTHLLEKDHLTRNGGKYIPKEKHIEPVHNDCINRFEKGVEEIVKNGG